jgi:hypothetical protein
MGSAAWYYWQGLMRENESLPYSNPPKVPGPWAAAEQRFLTDGAMPTGPEWLTGTEFLARYGQRMRIYCYLRDYEFRFFIYKWDPSVQRWLYYA